MSIRLLEVARRELHEAVDWYAAQAPGLGDVFLIEVLRAFDLIESYPDSWHPLTGDIRRCRAPVSKKGDGGNPVHQVVAEVINPANIRRSKFVVPSARIVGPPGFGAVSNSSFILDA